MVFLGGRVNLLGYVFSLVGFSSPLSCSVPQCCYTENSVAKVTFETYPDTNVVSNATVSDTFVKVMYNLLHLINFTSVSNKSSSM